jgi:hypothetical protein
LVPSFRTMGGVIGISVGQVIFANVCAQDM